MATSVSKNLCFTCNKQPSVGTCDGCQRRYCMPHFTEHRQQLAQRMDGIGQDHDLLKQDLTRDSDVLPSISRINEWEEKSIKMIRVAASQARADIQHLMQKTKNAINKSVDTLTQELRHLREAEGYTEQDLDRWSQQLQDLRNQLLKPPTIHIENDQKISSWPMIKVTHKSKFTSVFDALTVCLMTSNTQTNYLILETCTVVLFNHSFVIEDAYIISVFMFNSNNQRV